MAEESGVPCVQRDRPAAGTGRRVRFHRARIGDYGQADRGDAASGDVVLPDSFPVLQRLGGGGYSGWKARSRAGRGARNHVQEGPEGTFENCFWNGYGWDSVDGTDRTGIQADGGTGNGANGRDSIGDLSSGGDAGHERRDWCARSRRVRRSDRSVMRSAEER